MNRNRYTVQLHERAVWHVTLDADNPDQAILGARMHWVANRPKRNHRVRLFRLELTDAEISKVVEVST